SVPSTRQPNFRGLLPAREESELPGWRAGSVPRRSDVALYKLQPPRGGHALLAARTVREHRRPGTIHECQSNRRTTGAPHSQSGAYFASTLASRMIANG